MTTPAPTTPDQTTPAPTTDPAAAPVGVDAGASTTTTPTDTTPPAPPAPVLNLGQLVALDFFDSYTGQDVTDLFLVAHAYDVDSTPRVRLAHVGRLSELADLPASSVRVL